MKHGLERICVINQALELSAVDAADEMQWMGSDERWFAAGHPYTICG